MNVKTPYGHDQRMMFDSEDVSPLVERRRCTSRTVIIINRESIVISLLQGLRKETKTKVLSNSSDQRERIQWKNYLIQVLLAARQRPLQFKQQLALYLCVLKSLINLRLGHGSCEIGECDVSVNRDGRVYLARFDLLFVRTHWVIIFAMMQWYRRPEDIKKWAGIVLTMLTIVARTSSSFELPISFAMSPKPRVTYVEVSFLISHRGARSMTWFTSPMFFSCKYKSVLDERGV